MNFIKKDYIFDDVNKLKGVGNQLSKYLKKRKIEKIKDILKLKNLIFLELEIYLIQFYAKMKRDRLKSLILIVVKVI